MTETNQKNERMPEPASALRLARNLGLFVASSSVADNAAAVEPWADPRMQGQRRADRLVRPPRLPQAHQAAGGAAPKNGDQLDRWPDASGKKRDLLQAEPRRAAGFLATDALQAIRFDGRAAHFRLTNAGDASPAMTMFVVVVPHSNRESFCGFLAAAAKGQNDYVSGFNVDLGAFPHAEGADDQRRRARPAGRRRTCCSIRPPLANCCESA